jgi:hypothetical protein
MGDDHPSGDPLGLSADDLLKNLQGKNVEYFFGKINDSTNIMIDRFNAITGGGKYVNTTPMSAGTMMTTILTSVSLSLTASLTSSARTEGGGLAMKEVILVPTMPSWGSLRTENAARYGLKLPTSISELAAATTDKCINDFSDMIVTLKVAANPFAKGEMRATYYSQEIFAEGRTEIVVVKESMAASIKHLTRDKYEAYLACQCKQHLSISLKSTTSCQVAPADAQASNSVILASFSLMLVLHSPSSFKRRSSRDISKSTIITLVSALRFQPHMAQCTKWYRLSHTGHM